MKKKIYIVLLCMMMILSLVGCSKSQKSNDANSNTNILDTSYDEILKMCIRDSLYRVHLFEHCQQRNSYLHYKYS